MIYKFGICLFTGLKRCTWPSFLFEWKKISCLAHKVFLWPFIFINCFDMALQVWPISKCWWAYLTHKIIVHFMNCFDMALQSWLVCKGWWGIFRSGFLWNANKQVEQIKGLTFSWTPWICCFRFDLLWKANKHTEHLKDFFIGWTISLVILNCSSRSNCPSRLNTRFACSNIKMFKIKNLSNASGQIL